MTALKVTGISKALKNREIRSRATYRYIDDRHCYILNGREYELEEFNRLFPTQFQKINYKGANPDKTKV
jgi:aspartate oxidase